MSDFEPCPCGATPERIFFVRGSTEKFGYVVGECCTEWHVEFRTGYHASGSPELKELMIAAWNGATRDE